MRILPALVLAAVGACVPKNPPQEAVAPTLVDDAATVDALKIHDELELLISTGSDSEEDRVYAFNRVKGAQDDGSAGYAFAWAALAGRVAELRGAKAGKLVTQAEAHARQSLERDPEFRDGAATRMLGTLYVMAPPRLVEHGDSEAGLSMLEELAKNRPDDPRNQLRAAEAFIHLDDPEGALAHLCQTIAGRTALRPDENELLDALIEEAGGEAGLGCGETAPP